MQYGFDNATLKPYNHNFGFCLFHFPSHYMAEMISHKKNSYKQQAEKNVYHYVVNFPFCGKLSLLPFVYNLVAMVPDHKPNLYHVP